MIRTVSIPRLRGLGDLEISQGCVQYLDPTTGLYVSDPSTPCPPGSGGALPDDTGAAAAVAADAAAQAQAGSILALQQSGATSPSLVLAQSLMSGNVPSPLPGLGFTMPASVATWFWPVMIGAIALLLFTTSEPASYTTTRRSRR